MPHAPSDSRRLPDRRTHPMRWSTLRWHGFRRMGEGQNTYIDCPSLPVTALALWVCLASVADAYLTLCHLQAGGHEGNPVMALALAYGDTVFCWVKLGLTTLGMWVLAAHQQFPLALGYGGLLLYHLVLVCAIPR